MYVALRTGTIHSHRFRRNSRANKSKVFFLFFRRFFFFVLFALCAFVNQLNAHHIKVKQYLFVQHWRKQKREKNLSSFLRFIELKRNRRQQQQQQRQRKFRTQTYTHARKRKSQQQQQQQRQPKTENQENLVSLFHIDSHGMNKIGEYMQTLKKIADGIWQELASNLVFWK